ncbi:HAD-IA family hydrolase [Rhodoferax sp.]|uniref:HAD-IA family hydrolase n=1 Tax=Rhodoferax sp. TaxID=50421 RepID=UPI00260068D9|nr:HAD-IA family hydrolase [Rhodoferax sp.]
MVDTLDDFCVALNRMLGDLPAPFAASRVDRGAIEKLVGKGSEHLLKSVLALVYRASEATNSEVNDGPAASGEADLLERLYPPAWESYQRHYHQVNGQYARVFPGVQAGLQYLQARGLKLACLTNKPTAFAQALLQAKGLDGFFDLTFGGDAFERKKPDPLPLLATCAALGTAPQRTLMIGDSSNDAQAAHAAGCPVLLVTYGYNHGEPIREVKADAYLDSLQQLMAPDS